MTLSHSDDASTKKDAEKSEDLGAILTRLKAAQRKSGAPDYAARMKNLDKLEAVLLKKKDLIASAISKDFGNRAKQESLIADVFVVHAEIKHARAHLADWMEPESRDVAWSFLPGRAEVQMQPLGVIGIISPWNYPVQLALGPLVGALAAGNRVMIKPSEFTPETAELLKDMMHETFGDDQVVVVTGGAEVGVAFSKLAFDHLVFTGSTSVGKHVMRAAAENLVPVTLELGGKSPAIVGESFSITAAAEKIMVGKLFNCGQTCVAPDYVLLPKGRADAFVDECKIAAASMYPKIADNPDYTSIVNARHYDRLKSYLRDAEGKGAKIVELNSGNEELSPESRKMAPVLVLHAKEDMTVMQDEIFGPILPILTYETIDEAIAYVNDHPRPLALYYFEHSDSKVQKMLRQTISGGVTINDTILHVAQSDLPFGGVGASGIGHYHGREGFDAFTKKKPIFYQARINGSKLLRPPFGKTLDRFLRFMLGK